MKIISTIHVHSEGQIVMEKHITDTRTMCWEIYYIHPQSEIVWPLHAMPGVRQLPSGLQQQKSVDKHT